MKTKTKNHTETASHIPLLSSVHFQNEPEIHGYILLSEASELCTYSQEYLSLLARRGLLRAEKTGRTWYTKKEWLRMYIEEHPSSDRGNVKGEWKEDAQLHTLLQNNVAFREVSAVARQVAHHAKVLPKKAQSAAAQWQSRLQKQIKKSLARVLPSATQILHAFQSNLISPFGKFPYHVFLSRTQQHRETISRELKQWEKGINIFSKGIPTRKTFSSSRVTGKQFNPDPLRSNKIVSSLANVFSNLDSWN